MKLHGTIPGIEYQGKAALSVEVRSTKSVVEIGIFPHNPTTNPECRIGTVIELHPDEARSLLALIETAMRRARE